MANIETQLGLFIDSLREHLAVSDDLGEDAKQIAMEMAGLLSQLQVDNLQSASTCPIQIDDLTLRDQVQGLPPSWQTLGKLLLALLPQLPWYQRHEPEYLAFMAGHGNAQIIGPDGLLLSDSLLVGISLLKPNITYPNHQHPPAEIYLVLTEGEWWQEGQSWHTPGGAGYVYNQPHVVHAMRSQDKPLLAIWCLPL